MVPSELIASNGFCIYERYEIVHYGCNLDRKKELNKHLTKVQEEIFRAIKYEDEEMFKDLGGGEEQDLTFLIEVEDGVFFYPILVAIVIGNTKILREILKNPSVKANK